MTTEQKLPIAEIFTSPQGEGVHTGRLMTFIRLAGCSVGRPLTHTPARVGTSAFEILPEGPREYQEECSDWMGKKFLCDTDYRVKERLTLGEIVGRVIQNGGVHRVCITGGEPLIHDLTRLCYKLHEADYTVHLETSGTKPWLRGLFHWVCVSPKHGYDPELLMRADEVKVLIGDDFDWESFRANFIERSVYFDGKVSISPINEVASLNRANIDKCLELQKEFPLLRLTMQAHKVWGVR